MVDGREMTCIVCPNGCTLKVVCSDGKLIEVKNALCKKGIKYANDEILNPVRTLTTTVKVRGGVLPLVSVRSDRPIMREMLKEVVKVLQKVKIEAPVEYRQVIFENILGTGVNIISTREIEKVY